MQYSVKIYARIGELMQGVLSDSGGFLVSGLPSKLFYTEAILEIEGEGAVLPPKAQKALRLFLGEKKLDGTIRLESNIPPGKGLSSSSTDILSVLFLVNDYLQMGATHEELYRIAAAVEPTDPCLSDDIVVFRQNLGVVGERLKLPPMGILYFDGAPDRQVETLDVQRQWTEGTGRFYDWLLQRLIWAAEAWDYGTIFDCITYSAEYNQTIVPLPCFDRYARLAREEGCGLMVAHSGTIVGLLTKPERLAEMRERLNEVTAEPIYMENYSPEL
ncbi:MAG: hypothetical protein JST68_29650 [Bacteroidetes bacterium]|nr:hypothetical protein [Bacteroidota bacterium]